MLKYLLNHLVIRPRLMQRCAIVATLIFEQDLCRSLQAFLLLVAHLHLSLRIRLQIDIRLTQVVLVDGLTSHRRTAAVLFILLLLLVRGGTAVQAFALLDVDDGQVELWNLDVVGDLDELLGVAEVVLLLSLLIELVVFLFEQLGLLSVLLSVLQQVEECPFSVVGLEELGLELLGGNFVQLVVVIQLVEVVHELLVVLSGHVGLHLLHVVDLFLVAAHLLFHFLEDLVARGVPLLHVVVSSEEFLSLAAHGGLQIFLVFGDCHLGMRGYLGESTGDRVHQVVVVLVSLANFLEDLGNHLELIRIVPEVLLDRVRPARESLCFSVLLFFVGGPDTGLLVFGFSFFETIGDCLLLLIVLVDFGLMDLELLLQVGMKL